MNTSNPILSIIIPFYNSREKCERLLKGLLKINSCNIEAILIDDGSTDGTYEYLLNFKSKVGYACFVAKQQNKGPGGARNYGFRLSRGKYIWFVDSDDGVKKEAISFLESIADKNYDFIDFNIKSNDIIISSIDFQEGSYHVNQEIRCSLIAKFGRIFSKIIHRDFIEETGVLYPENCIYEDNSLSFIYPFTVKKFYKSSIVGYIHNEDFESITRAAKINERFFDRLATATYGFKTGANFIKSNDELQLIEEKFTRLFLLNTVSSLITRYPGTSWLMASRVMKYYRQEAERMTIHHKPTSLLNANKKYRSVFKLLWCVSYFLPSQAAYFKWLHMAAWGKHIKYIDVKFKEFTKSDFLKES